MKMLGSQGCLEEMKVVMKEVYQSASNYYIKEELSEVGELFFRGNMTEFGRKFYEVVGSVSDELNGLIMGGNVKKGMKEIIETITSFGIN
jgi:hypothetical protein